MFSRDFMFLDKSEIEKQKTNLEFWNQFKGRVCVIDLDEDESEEVLKIKLDEIKLNDKKTSILLCGQASYVKEGQISTFSLTISRRGIRYMLIYGEFDSLKLSLEENL